MPAPSLARCSVAPAGRRRVFWATQPAVCGNTELCTNDVHGPNCGRPGLEWIGAADPEGDGRTISTDNWIEGLILNILLTDAQREDALCGHLPGQRGGHWSDSFRTDGASAGSRVRHISPTCSVAQMVALVEGAINDDLQRLVTWAVALAVAVRVTYRGNNVLWADIEVTGLAGDRIAVGLAGTRLTNAWAWTTQRAA